MAALLTLLTCLIAATVAIGYAYVAGLTVIRRAAAVGLALALGIGAGRLLVLPHASIAHIIGPPCLLLIGAIVLPTGRRVRGGPGAERVPVPAILPPAFAPVPRQFDRRASRPSPLSVLHDPWAALYASIADHEAQESIAAHEAQGSIGEHEADGSTGAQKARGERRKAPRSRLAGKRTEARRRSLPRSVRRASRCRCR